jgi:hypothetical protein
MDAAAREFVRNRAQDRCEYCGLEQSLVDHAPFVVEHIIAKQHRGGDESSNLALACDRCNAFKGPNIAGLDPQTGSLVPLFNPRQQVWREHFAFAGTLVVGLTPVGRTTVAVLNMNATERVQLRAENSNVE